NFVHRHQWKTSSFRSMRHDCAPHISASK
ncbi:hypothetical protein GCK32_022526, partial [Trichostrongylus colubriformis]